jgi:PilZ domain
MKYEAILAAEEYLARDTRIDITYDVSVECEVGEINAEVVNLSSDGFRLRSRNPLQVGWEVTLKSGKHDPVKAIICWACGHESGGVFSEPVAL